MDLPGFFYFENIVENSTELMAYLEAQKWSGVSKNPTGNGRKVLQYGYEYDYGSRNVSSKKIEDIPELLTVLQTCAFTELTKLGLIKSRSDFTTCKSADADLIEEEITRGNLLNQCIVNKYELKQGISAHIDKLEFGPVIVCFTLGSGTVIHFKNTKTSEIIEKYVSPNSLYIMSGESRLLWTHEIKPRLTDKIDGKSVSRGIRISVTFRSVTE